MFDLVSLKPRAASSVAPAAQAGRSCQPRADGRQVAQQLPLSGRRPMTAFGAYPTQARPIHRKITTGGSNQSNLAVHRRSILADAGRVSVSQAYR